LAKPNRGEEEVFRAYGGPQARRAPFSGPNGAGEKVGRVFWDRLCPSRGQAAPEKQIAGSFEAASEGFLGRSAARQSALPTALKTQAGGTDNHPDFLNSPCNAMHNCRDGVSEVEERGLLRFDTLSGSMPN
jgi:hypothetical protein